MNKFIEGNYFYLIDRTNKFNLPIRAAKKITAILYEKVYFVNADDNPASVEKHFECFLSDITGIPLSEEWLLKNQFIAIDDDGLYESENESLFQLQNRYLANDGFDLIFDTSVINYNDKPIKYIHNVQNVYSAIIGEDLKNLKSCQ